MMFVEGLTESEKRRLTLRLKEKGHMAFMVIKHANAAVISQSKGHDAHPVDLEHLIVLDSTIEQLFGFKRRSSGLSYAKPVIITSQKSSS